MVDFDRLNERQREAVQALMGRIKVVAGAGSGKTRVLASRYAHLAENIGIDTGNILCITFTNKAAQEMKRRIGRMIDNPGHVNDYVCTIHGLCVKFLREEIYRLGFPKTFSIIDDEDRKAYARKVLETLEQDRTATTIKNLLDDIEGEKNMMREQYVPYMLPQTDREPSGAFHLYLAEQLKTMALDFDDLIYFTLHILHNHADAREKWQDRMNFVMVDEAQDCNSNDWTIIETLAAKHGNLFVVGDPDQAIYEWRGAKPDTFVNMQVDQQVILDINYRSIPNILDVANSVIAHNQMRIKKDLVPFRTALDTNTTIYYHAQDEPDEAHWVVRNKIQPAVEERHESPSDFAILYRSSHMSRAFEQELIRAGVPYTIWGGIRFFERKEIKDVIAYLKLIANPHDDMALARVINVPSRKFGPKRMTLLQQLAQQEGTSLMATLAAHVGEKPFDAPALGQFVKLIAECNATHAHTSLDDLVEHVLLHSGLKDDLRNDSDEDRLENVNELVESIKLFVTEHQQFDQELAPLVEYLQDIALYTNADKRKYEDTVKLMTIHQAKGLEFPSVFVVGLTEGLFPNHRYMRERKEIALEEERRLMYVAVTRARDQLYLSESEGYSYATGDKLPSRFLLEIEENLYRVEGKLDKDLFEQTRALVSDLDIELNIMDRADEFGPGTQVTHAQLGDGEIVENYPERQSCKVNFGAFTLNISHNKLTIK